MSVSYPENEKVFQILMDHLRQNMPVPQKDKVMNIMSTIAKQTGVSPEVFKKELDRTLKPKNF